MDCHLIWRDGLFPSLLFAVCLTAPCPVHAEEQTPSETLDAFQQQLDDLREQMAEKDRRIGELEERVKLLSPPPDQPGGPTAAEQAIEAALREVERDQAAAAADRPGGIVSVPITGGANLRLIDISIDVLSAAGASSERDEELQTLQGGAHDPRKRGFTLQQAELSLTGAVDPYLYGEAHIIYSVDPLGGETLIELEEAFMQTQTLPAGLQVEAGFFFTEFGLINPSHPHAWDWLDQPVVNSRIFGGDGLRQAGARLGWLTPLPWFSELHFGVQNASGETAASFLANDEVFEERAIGGRPFTEQEVRSPEDLLYLFRWVNAWELNDEWSLQLGGSALYGPNATGGDADTRVYGGDLLVKWRPVAHQRGWPFLKWQSELIYRDYDAAAALHPGLDAETGTADDVFLPADTLEDWGFYSQVLYGFRPRWAAGVRYEYATGEGDSVGGDGAFVSHNDDPFRDDRHRISPLVIWQPTEFSRFRLQYNYDHAAHLDDHEAHSVWFGVEFLFGAHPAHNY